MTLTSTGTDDEDAADEEESYANGADGNADFGSQGERPLVVDAARVGFGVDRGEWIGLGNVDVACAEQRAVEVDLCARGVEAGCCYGCEDCLL